MKNRLGAVKVAQEFGSAFNRQAVSIIDTMLDAQVVYSQQNVEGSLIGKKSVLNRLRHQFEASTGGNPEIAQTAIIDLSDIKSHPCLVVSRGAAPTALILLDIKFNNLIKSITVLTSPDTIAKARITTGR